MNIKIKLRKAMSVLVVIFAIFVITAFSSSAAMSQSEFKSRLSSYSSWIESYDKGVYTLVCPYKDLSHDKAFSYINTITSLLRGDIVDDYCELTIKFSYSENRYEDFDAFTVTAFTFEDKIKSFWTNWSETNQMDLVCNYTKSSSGVVFSANVELQLNGSDPDKKISDYDEKLQQIVNNAKRSCSTKMQMVQYYCNWLDKNVKYSLLYQLTNSPYYALMKGKGVCGSYANALKDMCELSGIPAIVPVNQDELNHAWNEVYVNGRWYTVDLCYVVEPVDGKYNGFCFANPDRKKFPVDHYSFIENHKAEYVKAYSNSVMDSVSDCKVSSIASQTYTGKAVKPAVTVKYGNTTLKKNVHYTLTYSANTNVGRGKITIKGIPDGGYKGTKVVYFNIVPQNPSKIRTSSNQSSIKLSWSAVSGAKGYRVYVYNSKSKSYSILKDFTQERTITVKKLSSGTKYKFAVKSYAIISDKVKWASGYTYVTAATAPAKVSVKAAYTKNSITLSWNKVSGADGYRVFRYNPSSKSWTKLVTTSKTSFTAKNLAEGRKYTFAVRPYIKVGSVVYWGSYDKLTFSTKLPTVTLSSVVSPSKGKITVKWSAVSGADGYQIYYKYNKNDSYKKLTNVTGSKYTASVKSGACYIKVRAYTKVSGGYAYSDFSAAKTIKVK